MEVKTNNIELVYLIRLSNNKINPVIKNAALYTMYSFRKYFIFTS